MICSNTCYFPSIDNSTIDNSSSSDEQIKRFTSFIHLLEENSYFKDSLAKVKESERIKQAISFYIEASYQLNSDQLNSKRWIHLDGIEKEIQNFWSSQDQEQSYKKATWLLAKAIISIYTDRLAFHLLNNPNDKTTHRFLKNSQSSKKMIDYSIKANRPATIGGIHNSFIPAWYSQLVESY